MKQAFAKWFHRGNRSQLLQCVALAGYIAILHFYLGVDRIFWHFLATLAVCFFLDLLLFRARSGIWRFPLSSFITAMGIYILTRSRFTVVPYLCAAVVAIGNKYIFRNPKSHVFNPANIGILTVFAFMPHLALPGSDQWSGTPQLLALIYLTGVAVAAYARRLTLALSYILALLLFSWLRSWASDLSIFYLLGPAIGTSGVVFTFHMITDPMTTPASRRRQFIFGVAVAAVDFVLRYFEVFYAPFMALALISALYSAWLALTWQASVEAPAQNKKARSFASGLTLSRQ